MAFVGDVIMSARELMTDNPQVLSVPTLNSLNSGVGGSPGFAPGTYFFVVTQTNPWGESLPSNELSVTLGVASNIGVTVTLSPGATGFNIYGGTAAGGENQVAFFAGSPGSNTVTLVAPIGASAIPPSRSSAYLPDTDGAAVSAAAVYRWMNQALAWAAGKNRGGIPAFSAVGTVAAQPVYNMNGYWKKIDTGWYDGYPLYLARKNDVFRKAPVPGYVGALLVHEASNNLLVETWPQPSRTSCQTTLSSPMLATDTVANLTNASAWVLGFGKAKIGTEIVEYSALNLAGNQLTGLVRGLAQTVPQAQSTGTAVTELNLEISGMMVPSTYTVGSSLATLDLPPGWDEALMSYMLYRFRSGEQDDQAAQRYLQEATQKMSDLSANRIIAGPRQIQANAGRGAETMVGLGSPFGGVIVP